MPIIFNQSEKLIATRILEYSEHYPILDADNDCLVSIDSFAKEADFCIFDNLDIDFDKLIKNKQDFRIKNIVVRNFYKSDMFTFHLYLDDTNTKYTFQNWEEVLRYTAENIMEKVCFARN